MRFSKIIEASLSIKESRDFGIASDSGLALESESGALAVGVIARLARGRREGAEAPSLRWRKLKLPGGRDVLRPCGEQHLEGVEVSLRVVIGVIMR